tara:strand:- start:499 stop:738 length:240 start_codon:yes stop_codon:yes gene_type:complete
MERFGIVNSNVVTDPELSLQAKGLYALLCTYANKNRTCFPSINTLADLCDVNPSTIHRILNKLKEKGYVKRVGRKFLLA